MFFFLSFLFRGMFFDLSDLSLQLILFYSFICKSNTFIYIIVFLLLFIQFLLTLTIQLKSLFSLSQYSQFLEAFYILLLTKFQIWPYRFPERGIIFQFSPALVDYKKNLFNRPYPEPIPIKKCTGNTKINIFDYMQH